MKGWTRHGHLRHLKTIFNGAVRARIIRESPARDVTMPEPEQNIAVLSPQHVDLLIEALPEHMRGPVITQAELGLRANEVLGLHTDDINLSDHAVDGVPPMTADIRWQRDHVTGQRKPPKRGSRRQVPITRYLAEVLTAHGKRFPPLADGSLFYAISVKGGPGRNGSMSDSLYHWWFAKMVRKVRAAHPDFPTGRVTGHALRHHYGSHALALGVPEAVVAAAMGHKGTNTLRKTYEHAMPGQSDLLRAAQQAARVAMGRVRETRGAEDGRVDQVPDGDSTGTPIMAHPA